METITYNLCDGSGNSNSYYTKIEAFADNVISYVEDNYCDTISLYQKFIKDSEIERFRSRGEYIIEFITLGMTWRRYAGAAQVAPKYVMYLQTWLFFIRNNYHFVKSAVDHIRGLLNGKFLVLNIGQQAKNNKLNLENFERLLLWLKASGEFKDEVKRLKNWHQLCKSCSAKEMESLIKDALNLIEWFSKYSEEELGEYTNALSVFLNREHKNYKFREDYIFTGKEAVEYHLNMAGSEIMNRGFREGFEKKSEYVLLVPGCMRINPEKCSATENGLDRVCTSCNAECRVSQLKELGKKTGFKVYIVPHSSNFTLWLKRWQKDKNTGLIAAACLLNLVPGGYEMRELGLDAQCILLDYCGCKKHWHYKGITTDLNDNRLLRLICSKSN